MNKALTAILLFAVFVGGFIVLYRDRPVQQETPAADDRASVTIMVTPLDIAPGSSEWKFDVVRDTHSVELDQDMTKIAVLRDDQGKEYPPVRWDGAPPGGHHREGILVFGAVQPTPQTVEIVIKNVGEIPERLFKWNMGQVSRENLLPEGGSKQISSSSIRTI